MTTQEVANRLVALCREGKYTQAQDELYAENAKSIEMEALSEGPLGNVEGLEAIREKGKQFDDSYTEFYGTTTSDPLVAGNFFTVKQTFDADWKQGGRYNMEEICVYEVADGKIVREQFFYPTPGEGS